LQICAILYHARIIPEQNASKIVKISQQTAKLWRKLKWLVFFWDTVYIYNIRCKNSRETATLIVCPMQCIALDRIYKKAQLTQREARDSLGI